MCVNACVQSSMCVLCVILLVNIPDGPFLYIFFPWNTPALASQVIRYSLYGMSPMDNWLTSLVWECLCVSDVQKVNTQSITLYILFYLYKIPMINSMRDVSPLAWFYLSWILFVTSSHSLKYLLVSGGPATMFQLSLWSTATSVRMSRPIAIKVRLVLYNPISGFFSLNARTCTQTHAHTIVL